MSRHGLILAILAIGAACVGSQASAAEVCQGPAATPGAVLHGPVLEISDSASLCIASAASPTAWTRVSVRQLHASRPVLMAAAFGQNATCRVGADGQADCSIEGVRLADTVNRPEVVKASMQWRQRLTSTQVASAAP